MKSMCTSSSLTVSRRPCLNGPLVENRGALTSALSASPPMHALVDIANLSTPSTRFCAQLSSSFSTYSLSLSVSSACPTTLKDPLLQQEPPD